MRKRNEEHSLPAVHILHLVELLDRWGVTADEALAPTGLGASDLVDPHARVSIDLTRKIIERARALTGEPGLGIYLGLQMRVSSHGYLGFAALTSATVRGAIAIAEEFFPTRTSALAVRLHVEGSAASLVLEERAPLGSARDVVILALLIGISRIANALTGRELEGGMELAFAEPDYFDRFRSIAGSALRFGQPMNRLVFDASVLDLPLSMADPAALALAREQCEQQLNALGYGERVSVRVRHLLLRATGGFLSVEEVAKQLHVSPRTLKRMLAAEGTRYSRLLEEERHERSLLLLRSPALSVHDVALRLGYSDAANFTRAFRRWTEMTPHSFRKGM